MRISGEFFLSSKETKEWLQVGLWNLGIQNMSEGLATYKWSFEDEYYSFQRYIE